MDYCTTCRRHLNGALTCPGCGEPTGRTADDAPGAPVPDSGGADPTAALPLTAEEIDASDDADDEPPYGRRARRAAHAARGAGRRRYLLGTLLGVVVLGLAAAGVGEVVLPAMEPADRNEATQAAEPLGPSPADDDGTEAAEEAGDAADTATTAPEPTTEESATATATSEATAEESATATEEGDDGNEDGAASPPPVEESGALETTGSPTGPGDDATGPGDDESPSPPATTEPGDEETTEEPPPGDGGGGDEDEDDGCGWWWCF
jgi:hypothetical protein